jgi:methyl-accepting chemotaxis protein
MKVSNSIGFKINLAFGTALVLSVAVLATVGALNVRHQAVSEFEQSSQARITQADGSLDGTFSEVEQNLTYLAQTPS